MLNKRLFYIDGQWVPPQQPNDCEVIDPSTEKACAIISLGSKADTNKAVAAAKTAFNDWAFTTPKERIALVERILACYRARNDEMAHAISLEMGAPIDMALAQQADAGSYHIENFIKVAKDFHFERSLPSSKTNRILYEGIGVCGLITPWNWPMNQVTLKVIPALIAGCTVVLKPSEIAPLSSMLFSEIMNEAKTPNGVFNLVNGDGLGVGTDLAIHPDVDMISFTGSTRAGIEISKNAATTLKRVHLEMGGKGANIIFADSDPKAVKRGVLHCFNNTGQSCNAPTRMLVERSIYDEAVATAQTLANQAVMAPANQKGRHYGPVVSKAQFDKIQTLIQKGIDEGAKLVAGGTGRPDKLKQGFFVRPTVFADVSNDMTIAREEIFGPVLSIIPFDNEKEAIGIANDTIYGLTNYIQTQDPSRCNRLARQLRSGMVEINGVSRPDGAPFGGMKASGNGREGGTWGLEDFMEVKVTSGWHNIE